MSSRSTSKFLLMSIRAPFSHFNVGGLRSVCSQTRWSFDGGHSWLPTQAKAQERVHDVGSGNQRSELKFIPPLNIHTTSTHRQHRDVMEASIQRLETRCPSIHEIATQVALQHLKTFPILLKITERHPPAAGKRQASNESCICFFLLGQRDRKGTVSTLPTDRPPLGTRCMLREHLPPRWPAFSPRKSSFTAS